MVTQGIGEGVPPPRPILKYCGLIFIALLSVTIVSALAGLRFGFMLAIGLGFGIVLEGLRFGFAGPWRAMILRRDPSGLWAQLLSIGCVTLFALPLIAVYPGELVGASAPVGFSMVAGAFIFGAAMQVVLGCGSGTLVNAGSGNLVSLVALPFFATGSFAGAYHLIWWTELGTLSVLSVSGLSGAIITLCGLSVVAVIAWVLARPENRKLPRRLVIAALTLSLLAILNLVVAGQPWGVVYGLGLWIAKLATALGADTSASVFWSTSASIERVQNSILTDYTSLTNIGIIFGAFLVTHWRNNELLKRLPKLNMRAWIATAFAGFLMGYSARLAFGCNVGAFYSGISTGSLHGWVWFVAAFVGSVLGVRLRPILGFEAKA